MFSSNTSQVSGDTKYIEDYFSTFLYSGTGAAQTITNGIDLATKGGLVWFKSRSGAYNHALIDTARGGGQVLSSNTTSAQADYSPQGISAFNTNGFTFGTTTAELNNSSNTYTSWTIAKSPKFFDVVTYTGNGSGAGQTISHNLGSAPGVIMVKCLDIGYDWIVYHRSLGTSQYLNLNLTGAAGTADYWNSTTPTATTFSVSASSEVNRNGNQYVAYLFAHNAGGFGLTGTDNVISCGSYTGNGSTDGPVIDLGYEPQWLLIKSSSASSTAWILVDNMRGMTVGGADAYLKPNSSDAETTSLDLLSPTATGFKLTSTLSSVNGANDYIYIAIRRGPMKVPTSGTSVYNADTTITATTPAAVSGFVTDLMISTNRTNKATYNQMFWSNRLTGDGYTSSTISTAEQSGGAFGAWDTMNGSGTSALQSAGVSDMAWMFKRAPGFFDEVCWTGTGSGSQAITHNLGVAPEFTITKRRSGTGNWSCFPVMFGVNTGIYLDSTAALQTNAALHPTLPTATTYYTNDASWGDENIGGTFVTYLFATCAGVSKVGSYTGTGTTLQVNCGFTGGARFVLIKRTDSTGDWYVWDSARGIVSGNDPYLLLNSTAAETTGTDYIDTYSAGFEISSTAPAAINASGGSFIFLAIS